MEERRREARTVIDQIVAVEDETYGEVLGTLVDLSPQGLRIAGEFIEVGHQQQKTIVVQAQPLSRCLSSSLKI